MDEGVNRGIKECFVEGLVSSVSLISQGPAFENALSIIRKYEIPTGVHLCLTGGRPILPKAKIPGIADERGRLPKNYRDLFMMLFKRKIGILEVKQELEAQIEKILDNGIMPTHLDSHQYVHLMPSLFKATIELARKYNIKFIRYPKKAVYPGFMLFGGILKMAHLFLFSRRQVLLLKNNNISCADFAFGFAESGRLTENKIKRILSSLRGGLNDLTCHPGLETANIIYDNWRKRRECEANALRSPAIKDLIKDLNIKITNYAN